jgi:hypothetical protein
MDARLTSAVLVVAVAWLSACETSATPGVEPGPAFEVVGRPIEADCGDDTCVRFRVRNLGDAGPGNCRLFGNSPGVTVPGPPLQLPVMQRGDSRKVTLRWSGEVPRQGLQIGCEPGLRS